ncbi:MAG: hypothetical protein V4726_19635, partial [Verrucomicrobiota bacterium]
AVFPPGKGSAEKMEGPWRVADSVPNTLDWKPAPRGTNKIEVTLSAPHLQIPVYEFFTTY